MNKEEEEKVLNQKDFNYDNEQGRMEITAIVAHELGHWYNMDSCKHMAFNLFTIYLTFFFFSQAFNINMSKDFGFAEDTVFLKLYIFFSLLEPFDKIIEIFTV